MKKIYLLFFVFAFISNKGFSTSYTISATNSQFTWSPDSVSAEVGDTINFSFGNIHTVVEVSQSTWLADGVTSNGGFQFSSSPGQVVLTQAKTYYYVCGVHASFGMKGRIFVSNPSGIRSQTSTAAYLDVYPNPFAKGTTVKFNLPQTGKGNVMTVYDVLGRNIFRKENVTPYEYIELTGMTAGAYILTLQSGDFVLEKKIIVSR